MDYPKRGTQEERNEVTDLSHRRSLDRRFNPPSKQFRGRGGFFGQSTRQGHYGFFGGGAGGGKGGGGFFDPFRQPQPYPAKPPVRYMNHKFKQFGRKRAALRMAEQAIKFGFNLSPLKKGLIAWEILDGALAAGELLTGYYLYDKDWQGGGWYTKKTETPPEWHIPPGYSCYSLMPGICGGASRPKVIGQQQIIKTPINCATWHYCGQGTQSNPPAAANVFFGGPLYPDLYRFGVELVVQYPWTGQPVPKPWYGPGGDSRTMQFPQDASPPRPVYSEAYQEPSAGGGRKIPRYAIGGFTYEATPYGGWATKTPHARMPPIGEKERKTHAKMRQVLAAAARLYDKATEAKDIIDAIHEALPKKYQVKGGLIAKTKAIYDHFDQLDMAKAVANLAANHYTDKVIGKLHSYGKKAPYGSSLGHPLHNPFW